MRTGTAAGMRLMDAAIQSLLNSRVISGKEAFKSIDEFEQFRNALPGNPSEYCA